MTNTKPKRDFQCVAQIYAVLMKNTFSNLTVSPGSDTTRHLSQRTINQVVNTKKKKCEI